jgi:hypothetical protein
MLRNFIALTGLAALLAAAAPAMAYTLPADSLFASAAASPAPTPISEVDAPPAAERADRQDDLILISRNEVYPIGSNGIYASCIDFRNVSGRTMTAIRFNFIYENAFGEAMANFHGDREGEFSPFVTISGPKNIYEFSGALATRYRYGNDNASGIINNCWTYFVGGGSINAVHVQVLRIMYADGTSWAI